ncbi:recombinase family protein [Streptomyces mutabilis]|uniref:recombinase family protein n=1 Tax=Streptomyces mutabilis TaxID=67332 RepID=UPI0034136B9E
MTRPLVLDSYTRESRRGDKRRLSVTGQHTSNEQRIRDLGAVLGEHLDNQGKSAWKPDMDRKDWNRLIARLVSKESDGVAIFDLERFIRQVKDAVHSLILSTVISGDMAPLCDWLDRRHGPGTFAALFMSPHYFGHPEMVLAT